MGRNKKECGPPASPRQVDPEGKPGDILQDIEDQYGFIWGPIEQFVAYMARPDVQAF